MKKMKQIAIIVGISAIMVIGCKGKEAVIETDMVAETTKETLGESTTEEIAGGANRSNNMVEERWTKLWPGEEMEVNLNAKGALIGGFVKDGSDMYMAARYNYIGKYDALINKNQQSSCWHLDFLYCTELRNYFLTIPI